MAVGSVVAIATFVVLAAWPLAVQLLGPQNLVGRNIQGDAGGATFYSLDLANLVVPTQLQWASPDFLAPFADGLIGTLVEQTGYLGVPLLLAVLVAAIVLRGDHLVRWLLLTAVATVVLALGPTLHIDGDAFGVPMPMQVLRSAPVLENLLPVRLMAFVYLAVALVIGRLVEWVLAQRASGLSMRAAGLGLIAACAATLLPAGPLPAIAMSSQRYLQYDVPRDAAVVVFPYPSAPANPQGMYWSAVSGVRYKFVGGEANVPDRTQPKRSLFAPRTVSGQFSEAIVEASATGQPVDPRLVDKERQELARYQIQYVFLYVPGRNLLITAQKEISRLLQRAPQQRDGALVWPVI
jgi:hypothetical protein